MFGWWHRMLHWLDDRLFRVKTLEERIVEQQREKMRELRSVQNHIHEQRFVEFMARGELALLQQWARQNNYVLEGEQSDPLSTHDRVPRHGDGH